jgi:hypothetical protein
MSRTDLLDEKVVSQNGRYQRVRRWWRGVHPHRGTIILGWTGWETVEESDRVVPVATFQVQGNGERRSE